MEIAHADTVVRTCIGASDRTPKFECDMSANIQAPSAMTVSVTDNSGGKTNEDVAVSWTFTCSDANATSPQAKGGITGMTPLTEPLTPLPATAADGTCNVSATVTLPPNPTTQDPFTARLSYTPSASASPSPSPSPTVTSSSPVHQVVGFDSKCLDDRGNSSSNRAQVVIWTCSGSDPAENWRFSNNEFIHNGKCLNDQGNGGIRSKVILWTCNGASNEKWSELANGEIRLQSHGNTLCLDDPRSSTQNGTQLIVYTCTDSANQKWKHS